MDDHSLVKACKNGKLVFNKIGHKTRLTQAGSYRLKISCNYPNVETVAHDFRVIPGSLPLSSQIY